MLSEKKKEIVRRSQAKRRAEFRAKGLCIQCGKPRMSNRTLCTECNEKQKLASKKYQEKKCTKGEKE